MELDLVWGKFLRIGETILVVDCIEDSHQKWTGLFPIYLWSRIYCITLLLTGSTVMNEWLLLLTAPLALMMRPLSSILSAPGLAFID
jgi:hypothetical protein